MKRSSQTSIPSLSAPEELHLGLRAVPTQSPGTTESTVTAVIESQPTDDKQTKKAADKQDATEEEAKKVVKFVVEDSTKSSEVSQKQSEGKNEAESKEKVENADQPNKDSTNVEDKSNDQGKSLSNVDQSTEDSEKDEQNKVPVDEESEGKECKLSETESKTPTPDDSISCEERPSDLPIHRKDVKPAERPPSITGQKKTPSPPGVTSPSFVKDVTLPQKTVKIPESAMMKRPSVDEDSKKETNESTSEKGKEQGEQKKTSLPPFMSTVLLQPMKAEVPRPKSLDDEKADEESRLRWEKLRELEEELLGEKKKKVFLHPVLQFTITICCKFYTQP